MDDVPVQPHHNPLKLISLGSSPVWSAAAFAQHTTPVSDDWTPTRLFLPRTESWTAIPPFSLAKMVASGWASRLLNLRASFCCRRRFRRCWGPWRQSNRMGKPWRRWIGCPGLKWAVRKHEESAQECLWLVLGLFSFVLFVLCYGRSYLIVAIKIM